MFRRIRRSPTSGSGVVAISTSAETPGGGSGRVARIGSRNDVSLGSCVAMVAELAACRYLKGYSTGVLGLKFAIVIQANSRRVALPGIGVLQRLAVGLDHRRPDERWRPRFRRRDQRIRCSIRDLVPGVVAESFLEPVHHAPDLFGFGCVIEGWCLSRFSSPPSAFRRYRMRPSHSRRSRVRLCSEWASFSESD